jgi:hypothetical protein
LQGIILAASIIVLYIAGNLIIKGASYILSPTSIAATIAAILLSLVVVGAIRLLIIEAVPHGRKRR